VKNFLKTKVGVGMVCLFVCLMAFAFYRVNQRHRARDAAVEAEQTQPPPTEATHAAGGAVGPDVAAAARSRQQMQEAAYIGSYRQNAGESHQEQDGNGNTRTRRMTAAKPHEAGTESVQKAPPLVASEPATPPLNFTLRLQGHPAPLAHAGRSAGRSPQGLAEPMGMPASTANPSKPAPEAQSAVPMTNAGPAALNSSKKPGRFLPYGYPIKCELVFTIDSTQEESPLVGLVTAPAYNNGQLIIPAGAELHSVARPDPVRDRIFSGKDWVLIFPREGNKPNGRQLNVHGAALDRAQPDDNGLTWGITDGSYGLQGDVIRTMNAEEVQQFVATALGAAAASLQSRRMDNFGQETTENTPRNAALQGLTTDMNLTVQKIRAEIERNGMFIRVPAGKQFYFYPQQIIDPDLADISPNIAFVQ
jgi:hypothetical protein